MRDEKMFTNSPSNTTPQKAGCNVTIPPNNGSASTHVNLHYSLVPTTSRPQNTHHNTPTSFERKAIFRPNSRTLILSNISSSKTCQEKEKAIASNVTT